MQVWPARMSLRGLVQAGTAELVGASHPVFAGSWVWGWCSKYPIGLRLPLCRHGPVAHAGPSAALPAYVAARDCRALP